MFCSQCGASNKDTAKFCSSCGAVLDQPSPSTEISSSESSQIGEDSAPANSPQPVGGGPAPVNNPQPVGGGPAPVNNPQPVGGGPAPVNNPQPVGGGSAPVNNPQPVGSGTASTVNQASQPAAPMNGTDSSKIQSESSTFFILSIVVTVVCCWAAGIPAIIFSSKARRCVDMQDFTGAQEALKNAKLWTFVAIGVGAVVGVFVFFIFLLGMM